MESGEEKGKRKEEGESEGTFPLSLPPPPRSFLARQFTIHLIARRSYNSYIENVIVISFSLFFVQGQGI